MGIILFITVAVLMWLPQEAESQVPIDTIDDSLAVYVHPSSEGILFESDNYWAAVGCSYDVDLVTARRSAQLEASGTLARTFFFLARAPEYVERVGNGYRLQEDLLEGKRILLSSRYSGMRLRKESNHFRRPSGAPVCVSVSASRHMWSLARADRFGTLEISP